MAARRKAGTRWWQQRQGRWEPKLEAALASGDPGRVGLAWAIILAEGGQRGAQTKCVREWGVDPSQISQALSGKAPLSRQTAEQIARATKARLDVIWSGAHPFAIRISHGPTIEPGDDLWEILWGAARIADPSIPTSDDLKKQRPDLFP